LGAFWGDGTGGSDLIGSVATFLTEKIHDDDLLKVWDVNYAHGSFGVGAAGWAAGGEVDLFFLVLCIMICVHVCICLCICICLVVMIAFPVIYDV
jgi:hypothetical protein